MIQLNDEIRYALRNDILIDIITTGAKSGLPRKTEIWFMNIDGRIFICGTPGADGSNRPRSRRDWLANLKANPDFLFCFKESSHLQLAARAVPVTDPNERRRIMSAPETQWYRDQVDSIEQLVEGSPIVEVRFVDFDLSESGINLNATD